MKHRISPATVIASVALFFSLGGAGMAAQRYLITSKSQIAPWVRHALKGHRGPRGPRGIVGPTGTTGAQGATGTTGAPGTFSTAHIARVYSQPATLCGGDGGSGCSASLIAWCPAGSTPISGGWNEADKPPSDLSVNVNQPYGPGLGWEIVATNYDPQPVTLSAVAMCAS